MFSVEFNVIVTKINVRAFIMKKICTLRTKSRINCTKRITGNIFTGQRNTDNFDLIQYRNAVLTLHARIKINTLTIVNVYIEKSDLNTFEKSCAK